MTEEQLTHRTANREDGARLDIVAENFWGRDRQCAFFDVRVFNPFALDKNPGVRPIGIGDTARRIIAKAVLSEAKPDIQEASGCLQMCGGQIAGIEAAVHAVRTAFDSSDTEAVLLVDATNEPPGRSPKY